MAGLRTLLLLATIGVLCVAKDCTGRFNVISATSWSSLSGFPLEFLNRTSLLAIAPFGESYQREPDMHTILHTSDRRTYIRGNSEYFHLHVNSEKPVTRELVELQGQRVVDVRFAPHNSYPFAAILTSDGSVWTAGKNTYGNLAHHDQTTFPVFTRVQGLPPVIQIAMGIYHCVVLTANGTLFSWGHNSNKELGYDTNKQPNPSPREIEVKENGKSLKDVCCGWGYCAALWGEEVLTWGIGKPSRLGRPAPDSGDWNPSIVRLKKGHQPLVDIVQVACGYGHTSALSSSGIMYGWGDSMYGGLANGDGWNEYALPIDLKRKTPVELAVGQRTTMFKARDGHFYYVGYYAQTVRSSPAVVPDPSYPRDMLTKGPDGPDTWGAVYLDNANC